MNIIQLCYSILTIILFILAGICFWAKDKDGWNYFIVALLFQILSKL